MKDGKGYLGENVPSSPDLSLTVIQHTTTLE
jgi:hypothetical protein